MALLGEFGAAAREAGEEVEADTFTFYGKTFTVADRVGAMPLLRFAAVAESGVEAEEMEGLAAMHELLRDCLTPGDWPAFQRTAADNKADAEELMTVCAAIYQAVTGRPTTRPSVSAAGPSTTGVSLKESSSSGPSSPLGQVPPIQLDPRILELTPVAEVALALVSG